MDYCYGPNTTTRSLHDRTVEPLLQKLIEGYNTAVMVFGATGEKLCEPGQVVLYVILSCQTEHQQFSLILCSTYAHIDAADTGKTSLLEGRKGIAVDDDSTNSISQEGLAQLLGTSLFDMLEEKQLSTGEPVLNLSSCNHCLTCTTCAA